MILIDDFYSPTDYINILKVIKTTKWFPEMQPYTNTNIDNRLKMMPCYQSIVPIEWKEKTLDLLHEKVPSIKFDMLRTFWRKTLAKELLQSPLKDKTQGLIHQDDDNFNWAGIIYFNGLTIKGGTSLFLTDKEGLQIEPDVIFAAKPNRLVLYKSNIRHAANYDHCYKERVVQTVFLKV